MLLVTSVLCTERMFFNNGLPVACPPACFRSVTNPCNNQVLSRGALTLYRYTAPINVGDSPIWSPLPSSAINISEGVAGNSKGSIYFTFNTTLIENDVEYLLAFENYLPATGSFNEICAPIFNVILRHVPADYVTSYEIPPNENMATLWGVVLSAGVLYGPIEGYISFLENASAVFATTNNTTAVNSLATTTTSFSTGVTVIADVLNHPAATTISYGTVSPVATVVSSTCGGLCQASMCALIDTISSGRGHTSVSESFCKFIGRGGAFGKLTNCLREKFCLPTKCIEEKMTKCLVTAACSLKVACFGDNTCYKALQKSCEGGFHVSLLFSTMLSLCSRGPLSSKCGSGNLLDLDCGGDLSISLSASAFIDITYGRAFGKGCLKPFWLLGRRDAMRFYGMTATEITLASKECGVETDVCSVSSTTESAGIETQETDDQESTDSQGQKRQGGSNKWMYIGVGVAVVSIAIGLSVYFLAF